MEFKEVVKNRYSCKKFSDRQVENEKLTAILEAGRLAPTAKNLQEQHVYVVQVEQIEENVVNSSFTGLETL
jgi:nitroreductase